MPCTNLVLIISALIPDIQTSEWRLLFPGLDELADAHELVLTDGDGVGDEAAILQTVDNFLKQVFDFGVGVVIVFERVVIVVVGRNGGNATRRSRL